MPPTSLSQTPLFQHLLSSLPSLRTQIKDAVTASVKQWLLEIRNISAEVGRLAMDAMDARNRRWKARRDRDPLLQTVRVGSAVELVTYEKTECKLQPIQLVILFTLFVTVNVLDNEHITVDFKPLYECIHIYSTLNSLDDLRRSYQADRKVFIAPLLHLTAPEGHSKGSIRSHPPEPPSITSITISDARDIRFFLD